MQVNTVSSCYVHCTCTCTMNYYMYSIGCYASQYSKLLLCTLYMYMYNELLHVQSGAHNDVDQKA